MKKLLLCSASVLGLAFATSAWADSATVYLNQSGDGQTAKIDQSGNSNTVGAYGGFSQQNGGLGGGNALSITQSGTGNSVARDTYGFQSGAGNSATITQSGQYSDVELQQTGTGNGVPSDPNPAGHWANSSSFDTIVQDASSNGSKTSVAQNGNNNYFDIIQGNTGNSLILSQSGGGYGAEAYIRQGTQGWTADLPQVVWVAPGGNNNYLNVQQATANNTWTYVVAGQSGGDGNSLTINQGGDFLAADVIQNGSSNSASVSQYGDRQIIGLRADLSYDTPFTQTGSGNSLTASQDGSTNVLNGSQSGNIYNSILSYQHGGAAATVNQTGSYNTVNNYSQTGAVTLTATQTSNGSGSTLTNVQSGNSTASVIQTAYWWGGNSVSNTQSEYALATLTQDGGNNTIIGNQSGGGSAATNTVTVSQTTSGNYANYTQAGTGLTATITQH